jgi:hypothetical protein
MTMADILSAVNDARTMLANDEFEGAERILAALAADLEYMEWQRVRRGPMLDMALDLAGGAR